MTTSMATISFLLEAKNTDLRAVRVSIKVIHTRVPRMMDIINTLVTTMNQGITLHRLHHLVEDPAAGPHRHLKNTHITHTLSHHISSTNRMILTLTTQNKVVVRNSMIVCTKASACTHLKDLILDHRIYHTHHRMESIHPVLTICHRQHINTAIYMALIKSCQMGTRSLVFLTHTFPILTQYPYLQLTSPYPRCSPTTHSMCMRSSSNIIFQARPKISTSPNSL